MARFGFHKGGIRCRFGRAFATAGLILVATGIAAEEAGDAGCGTTKECAQEMVKVANGLIAENKALVERVIALEKSLADTAAQLRKERGEAFRVLREKDSVHYTDTYGNGTSKLCPVGFYMIGAKWQVDGGGPHGIMSWIGPVCRRF